MKPVSQEEYTRMQAEDWEWAKALIQCQIDDKRPGVQHLTNRPVINIKQMLQSSAELYGDGIAFYTKFEKGPYKTITHREVFDDVNAMGTALIANGMKDRRVAVIGETTYMWGIGYLELLISQDRREGADGILSQWELLEEGRRLIADGDRSFLDAQIDSREMSIIIFTSGTTGMAKGIMLSHRNIVADLMVSPTLVDFLPSDIFFSVLPIHHTFECTCNFIMPLYKGGAIAHCEGLKYIVKNIQEVHPTFLLAVPAIFEALHKAIWKGIRAKGKEKTVRKAMKICNAAKKLNIDLTNLFFKEIKQTLGGRMRMMICGGAAINPEILEDLQSFGIMALQGYGLSEAAPMGALNPENKPKSISCGIAFPGFDARINEPGADGVGEICLKGDNIMLGYYKNPEATAEVIKDGWFYTGDLGYIDDEGYIVITGRKKNVIITKNGKNVFPEELEYQLSLHDEIAESMVFEGDSGKGDGDKNGDTLIVAGIYPDWALIKETMGDEAEDDEAVRKYIWSIVDKVNAANPGYKMIKKVNLRHTEFEKNTSRKIRRFVEDNKKTL